MADEFRVFFGLPLLDDKRTPSGVEASCSACGEAPTNELDEGARPYDSRMGDAAI